MSPRPMSIKSHEGALPRMPWLSMAGTILLAAAILIIFRPGLQKWMGSYASRTSASPGLQAAAVGDSLQITWPAGLRTAALNIKDGDAWRRIDLDQNALNSGRYLYRPVSSEVLIRMDTETVRVMGLTPHPEAPPVPVAAPAPVVEVAQATPASSAQDQAADRVATPAASPEIAERKVPDPFPKALRSIHGTIHVDVQVAVAADGTVQSAEVLTPAKSPYFNRLSLAAAQGSRFKPGADGGSMVLRYEYSRAGVEVSLKAD